MSFSEPRQVGLPGDRSWSELLDQGQVILKVSRPGSRGVLGVMHGAGSCGMVSSSLQDNARTPVERITVLSAPRPTFSRLGREARR